MAGQRLINRTAPFESESLFAPLFRRPETSGFVFDFFCDHRLIDCGADGLGIAVVGDFTLGVDWIKRLRLTVNPFVDTFLWTWYFVN